ncbi:MAG: ABC transporter permease subunit [Candidatus Latescibacterota bacterium]|nr:ABC transporter permease subunit [Candidatus Latescibacterota bacterium]
MLILQIRKEIVYNVLSFRFAATYVLLFLLVLVSMFLMGNEHRTRMEHYTRTEAAQRNRLEELSKMPDASQQYREVNQEAFLGVRQPEGMSVLARGLESSLPTQVSSRQHWALVSSDDRLARNVMLDIFQTPDLAYVVNVVLSLLALLFVFDSVCGEKERGTLKVLLSNSVPRDSVLLGKWVGGYLSIATPFAVAVLGGFLYLSLSGAIQFDSEGVGRFAAITAVSFLHIAAFFSLGLFISTATHRASTALLMSLMVWICWILVVPNVAPVVARLAAPVASRQVIDAELRAIDREADLLHQAIRKRKVYGDEKESERIDKEAEHSKKKLEQFYEDRLTRQVTLGKNLARLSPSASYLFAVTRIAGTGSTQFDNFRAAVYRFQEEHSEYQRSFWDSNLVEWGSGGPTVKRDDWFDAADVPQFAMYQENFNEAVAAALFDILLLAVITVLFFMLSFAFFLRYDIT